MGARAFLMGAAETALEQAPRGLTWMGFGTKGIGKAAGGAGVLVGTGVDVANVINRQAWRGSRRLTRSEGCQLKVVEGGADIRFIRAMLGHAELCTTEIYTQVSIRLLKSIHTATPPAGWQATMPWSRSPRLWTCLRPWSARLRVTAAAWPPYPPRRADAGPAKGS